MQQSDLIIIGGGIVGLATAYRFLERFPEKHVTVLEKEATIARHQTGRNSGVMHTGIYYRPGSLKALNCRAGKLAMEEFCRREQIPFLLCGKIIVAVDESELPRMETLLERGNANGVICERIGPERIHELEPQAAGLAAIHIPEAGVVDYAQVARRLAELIQAQGSAIVTGAKVTGIRRDTSRAMVETTAGEFAAEQVVNCAGLYSDRVTRLSGVRPSAMIVPFRGEFYELRPEAHHLVRMLVYPCPIRNTRSWACISRAASTAASSAARTPCWRSPAKAIATRPSTSAISRKRSAIPASGDWPPATGGLAPTKCTAASANARSCGLCNDSCRQSNRVSWIGPPPASRASRRPRRPDARRFCDRRNRPRDQRRERPLPRRHRLAQHRPAGG